MVRTARFRLIPLVSLLVLAGVLAGCPKRPEFLDGQPTQAQRDGSDTSSGQKLPDRPRKDIRKDARADDALAQAQAKAANQSRSRGVETYMAVRRAYPDTTAGEEALYQAGTLAYESGDYVNARKDFNELLFENPLFDKARDAKLKLGMSALQTHAYRDAYQTLSSLAEHASGEEKQQLLDAAAKAAEGAQLWSTTLNIALKDVEEAQGPEAQKAALDRVQELVESKVPYPEVERAQGELAPTHPAWPLLTFKLTRVYDHLRDYSKVQEYAQKLATSAPSSPYTAQAQQLASRANPTASVKPRVVGVILPLTGRYKPVAEAALRGIQLALKGSSVELVVKDSAGDASNAAQAVEELVRDEGAIAIIGPLLPDEARHAAIRAEQMGVPLMTLTRSEGITELGPHVFRNMLTYSAQTKALVDWSTQVMGFKRFGMLYANAPYGKEFADDFWDEVERHGGEVRGAESYPSDATTYKSEAEKLVGRYPPYLDDRRDFIEAAREATKDAKDSFRRRKAFEKARNGVEPIIDFDAIFIPDDWQHVSQIAPALAVEDITTTACDARELEKLKKTTGQKDIKTVTLLGIQFWNSPKNSDGVPLLIERGTKFVTCSVYVDGFYADSKREATHHFVTTYREQYHDVPDVVAATSYDSARIVRTVLESKRPQQRAEMRDDLAAVKNFDGATGKTTFNERREAEKPVFFLTVDLHGLRELTPNERTNGT